MAIEKFLVASGRTVDEFHNISIKDQAGLLKETYIASLSKHNSPLTRYIIFKDERVVPLDLEQLITAYQKEMIEASSTLERKTIAMSLIRLADDDGPVFISQLSDIPGYKRHSIDRDLENMVRAPWEYKSRRGGIYVVLYTYTQFGGVVRRYKFLFNEFGLLHPADVFTFGYDIGYASYPE